MKPFITMILLLLAIIICAFFKLTALTYIFIVVFAAHLTFHVVRGITGQDPF